ncbi:peptidoglycan DD-metalloendopeptidase family protein [Gloeocapsopsis dulcis]|uniref:LysM domain-containing protein n=1 Tax=Gloeocapsopsis dulcis AAB1 = 1H9 TaxID=1433147 RepID=A0A6N8FSB9_9CHRO|nr:peptidoglycan DD-metalloendopeptidase family protein [Gloeocapsopsis dulcis]MUL35087.1 hypothetical protein [Gloeocapsopsis dulcis AAB1 = 1H9]WNN89833.1 peptidoglycan DD-metalloendopeptidase family protein [Gloeocapsopsis dulcis]
MKKVKAVPASAKSKAVLKEQLQPVQPKVKRRVRTSVAMMAIAISMGGPNLLLTRHDRAPAAEIPQGEEPTASKLVATTTPEQATPVVVEAVPAPVNTSTAPMSIAPAPELPVKSTVSQPVSPPAAKSTVQVKTPTRTTPIRVEQRQQDLAMDASPRKYTEPKSIAPSQVETTTVNSSHQANTAKAQAVRQDRLVQQLKSANINQSSAVQQNSSTQPLSNTNRNQLQTASATTTKDSSAISARQKLLVNRLKQQSNHSINSSAELRSEEFNSSTSNVVTPKVVGSARQNTANNSNIQLNQPTTVVPSQSNYEVPSQNQATVQPQPGGANQSTINTQPQILYNPQSSRSLDPLNIAPPITRTPQTTRIEPNTNSIVVDIKESIGTAPEAVIPQGVQQRITDPVNANSSQNSASAILPTTPAEFEVTNELQNVTPSSTQDTVAQVTETTRRQDLVQRLRNQTTQTNQSVVAEAENLNTPDTVYVISQAIEDTAKVSVQAALSTAYQVKPGDTLTAIAREYGVPLHELISANQISNPDRLQINQSITIPTSVYNGVAQNIGVSDRPLQQNTAVVPVVSTTISDDSEGQVPTLVAHNNLTVNAADQQTTQPVPQVVNNSTGMGGSLSNEEPLDPPSFYVQGLKAEIEQLRQKYNTQLASSSGTVTQQQTKAIETVDVAAAPVVKTKSVAPVTNRPSRPRATKSEPVNPEFRVAQATNSNSKTIRARLATAPSNVDPTEALHSLRGRQVTPELPPLGAADMYLPRTGMSAPFNGYIWPAKGVLSSGYGWRWGRMHRGIDVAAPVGTPIFAAASGVVVRAGWNSGGYGNLVDIRHPNGSLTRYAHNNRILVRAGQEVEQGQHIAEMGSTGFSTGPHLHFEVHAAGKGAVNPIALLPQR